MTRTRLIATAGTALIGAAALFSSAASAGGNVAWSVSVGGPGFAVTAGEPGYAGVPYRPYYRPHFRSHQRPVVVATPIVYRRWNAPVFVAAPYRAHAPRPVVYGPPTVVAAPAPYGAASYPYPGTEPYYRY